MELVIKNSEKIFIDRLTDANFNIPFGQSLKSEELANLFINSAMLLSIMDFIKENWWLENKTDSNPDLPMDYKKFIEKLIHDELSEVRFLKEFLIEEGVEKIKPIRKNSETIEIEVLSYLGTLSSIDKKEFMIHALREMNRLFLGEEKDQQGRLQSLGHFGPCLYRTFDHLDLIFKLDYEIDHSTHVENLESERLYLRSGVGVQSGYSTILLALSFLNPKQGAKMIDLGSGYGRVGLVCSLLRDDIKFIGYEFVAHRIDISNRAKFDLGISDNLTFLTQDLSSETFKIPQADIYYLYDPFTKETYEYVLQQLINISQNQKITVVTKGNARDWLLEISCKNSWPEPKIMDEGNLCIFESR